VEDTLDAQRVLSVCAEAPVMNVEWMTNQIRTMSVLRGIVKIDLKI